MPSWRCWLDEDDGRTAPGQEAAPHSYGWIALAYPSADTGDEGRELAPFVSASADLLRHLQRFADGPLGRHFAVVGISSQTSPVQAAMSKRLGLSIPLVSDPYGRVARALSLRSISIGRRHRLLPTLLIYAGREEVARFEGFDAIGLNMDAAVVAAFPAPPRPSGDGRLHGCVATRIDGGLGCPRHVALSSER